MAEALNWELLACPLEAQSSINAWIERFSSLLGYVRNEMCDVSWPREIYA